eukprot:87397-Alexandrium_andersonii.AAC.1
MACTAAWDRSWPLPSRCAGAGCANAAHSSEPRATASRALPIARTPVSYTHLRAHETSAHL